MLLYLYKLDYMTNLLKSYAFIIHIFIAKIHIIIIFISFVAHKLKSQGAYEKENSN